MAAGIFQPELSPRDVLREGERDYGKGSSEGSQGRVTQQGSEQLGKVSGAFPTRWEINSDEAGTKPN